MVEITDSAANILKDMIKANKGKGKILRIFIRGMGCSGAQYGLAFDKETTSDDEVIEIKDIKVAMKKEEKEALTNAKIDYVESGCSTGFTINVPSTASRSCGSCSGEHY